MNVWGSIKTWFKNRVALIISVLMLLYAVPYRSFYEQLPYGYYQILRFLVCGTCTFFSYKSVEQNRKVWAWILGIAAFLFNPIIPIHLDRDIWQNIDGILGVILIIFIFIPHKEHVA